MRTFASSHPSETAPAPRAKRAAALVGIALAAILSTVALLVPFDAADAQVNRSRLVQDREPVVEPLRLACVPDFVNGQRGVLCQWSEAANPATRGYQLFRITDGSARELITTVAVGGRLGFFDTDVSAPSSLVYGVISVNRNGRLLGQSAPVRVSYGQDMEQLRMACAPDAIAGQRGVSCQWSETTQPDARGYLVYRIIDGGDRQIIARVGLEGRNGHFDTRIVPGALHTYGVTAVDADGDVVAVGGPQAVRWPAAD